MVVERRHRDLPGIVILSEAKDLMRFFGLRPQNDKNILKLPGDQQEEITRGLIQTESEFECR